MRISEAIYWGYRILKWRLGNRSPILSVFKVTYQCNLVCQHCPWKELTKQEADSVSITSQMKKDYKEGSRIVVFEGGEPTLRDDLSDLIRSGEKIGFKVIIATNGTRSLQNLNPDLFLISIDGIRETHNKIRQADIYDDILENISSISVRKIALITLNKANYKQINKILSELRSYVDGFAFNIFYPYNQISDMTLNQQEIKWIYDEIWKVKDNYEIVNSKWGLRPGNWNCDPWLMKAYEPDGSIINGCFIKAVDNNVDCRKCHLACYKDLTKLARGDLATSQVANRFLFGPEE